MIDEIKRYNLVDEAYKRIKDSIISVPAAEGQKIPSENELCNALCVSRVVVREALQRLRSEHLIVTYQGKGTFIANPNNYKKNPVENPEEISLDFKDFKDIMDFRSALEYSAINLAISEATDNELKRLKEVAEEMENCCDDYKQFTEADYKFHLTVLEISHNKLFPAVLESFREKIEFCLNSMNRLNDSRKWAVSLHCEVADRICQRDAKSAIDLLRKNGEYNLAKMQDLFPPNKN